MSDAANAGAGTGSTGSNGAGASVSPGNAGGGGVASGDWISGLNDELKGYVQNKGFKDPAAVLESYRNLEKLRGVPEERLLKLPEKEDAPEWNDVYKRLGRPEKADDYQVEIPKEYGDEAFAKWSKETFHKLGLTKKQGESLAKAWNEYALNNIQQSNEQLAAKLEQEHQGLKTEWGQAFDQNVGVGKQAAAALGVKPEVIDQLEQVMGFAGVMKFFHTLGTKMGEGKFVGGEGAPNFGGALAPEAARSRIQALRGDPEFVKRYTNGDLSAREEMERLHKMAYGA